MYSYTAISSGNIADGSNYGFGVDFALKRYLSKSFDFGFATGFARLPYASDLNNSTLLQDTDFFKIIFTELQGLNIMEF